MKYFFRSFIALLLFVCPAAVFASAPPTAKPQKNQPVIQKITLQQKDSKSKPVSFSLVIGDAATNTTKYLGGKTLTIAALLGPDKMKVPTWFVQKIVPLPPNASDKEIWTAVSRAAAAENGLKNWTTATTKTIQISPKTIKGKKFAIAVFAKNNDQIGFKSNVLGNIDSVGFLVLDGGEPAAPTVPSNPVVVPPDSLLTLSITKSPLIDDWSMPTSFESKLAVFNFKAAANVPNVAAKIVRLNTTLTILDPGTFGANLGPSRMVTAYLGGKADPTMIIATSTLGTACNGTLAGCKLFGPSGVILRQPILVPAGTSSDVLITVDTSDITGSGTIRLSIEPGDFAWGPSGTVSRAGLVGVPTLGPRMTLTGSSN